MRSPSPRNVGPDLTLHNTLNMSAGAVSDIAWWYLIGEVIGALFFGRLSDKLGPEEPVHHHARRLPGRQRPHRGHAERRSLVHLPVRHPDHRRHGHRRRVRRDQLRDRRDDPGQVPRPRRPRGQRHLLGGRASSARSSRSWLLNHVAPTWGWRLAFLVGPVLALVIIYVRRNLPESPRWQIMHGREEAAEASIGEIEDDVEATTGDAAAGRREQATGDQARQAHRLRSRCSRRCSGSTRAARSSVAALMITQSFLYNAIFFTYGLVLEFFFHVKADRHRLLLLRVRGRQPARPADPRPAVRHDRPAGR